MNAHKAVSMEIAWQENAYANGAFAELIVPSKAAQTTAVRMVIAMKAHAFASLVFQVKIVVS